MSTTKIPNSITLYARQKGGKWVIDSPDAPGVVGMAGIRGGLGDNSGFEKALQQFRNAYVEQAKETGFGGIRDLKAALKRPALRTRFLPGDVVEVTLSTGGSHE